MSAMVEITEEDGEYRAIDVETGTTGAGETRAKALIALAIRLGEFEDADAREDVRALAERTRRRFQEEGITEDHVSDAIAWARSGPGFDNGG